MSESYRVDVRQNMWDESIVTVRVEKGDVSFKQTIYSFPFDCRIRRIIKKLKKKVQTVLDAKQDA